MRLFSGSRRRCRDQPRRRRMLLIWKRLQGSWASRMSAVRAAAPAVPVPIQRLLDLAGQWVVVAVVVLLIVLAFKA